MMRRSRFLLLLVMGALAAPVAVAAQAQAAPAPDVVVYFVRHAERADDGSARDPELSEAGHERARLLARMLADAGITHIHSTDYQRTRQTGGPLAEALGLEIASYDPRDLPGLAARLRTMPGRHLVVGHSNTTGEAVAAMGGDAHSPIDEAEYDRLYVVAPDALGARTTLIRFGAPFQK